MIEIKRNTDGDSRVATKVPTFVEFTDSNRYHRNDVKSLMDEFARIIKNIGENHDWSKVDEPFRSLFYRDLCNSIEGKINFSDGEWYKMHYSTERHHLMSSVPEDVNLFDVIEMIADCVCAGMARSGEVKPIEINSDILLEAFNNTVELAKSRVILDEEV